MRSRVCVLATAISCAAVLASVSFTFAAGHSTGTPAWLSAHVGGDNGQIAPVILQRARTLYLKKVAEGKVQNACYFAMDATRPNNPGNGTSGGRFYVICEHDQTFRVISAGHGGGRNLKGVVDFQNGRQCAKNFGNALDSNLTAGGSYSTAETKTSFKGYYRLSPNQDAVLTRSFVQFNGEGETANARERAIGGHAAALVSGMCLRKDPKSPYANHDGYVPIGKLIDYAGGRSDGCTSWSMADTPQILQMVSQNPTTLYIYPESSDISAVSQAVSRGEPLEKAGLYWNPVCLKEIGQPRFWPKQNLEPLISKYKNDHPTTAPKPLPICEAE